MPKLDGYGLLRLIRGATDERIKKLPVIVISGSQDQAAQSRARQAGANDFISKSADAPDVLSRIEATMRSVKPAAPRAEAAAASQQPAAQTSQPAMSATASQQVANLTAVGQQNVTHDTLTGTLAPQTLVTEARKHFSHAK